MDALAFVLAFGTAWWGKWGTTDLVWSLWLSSLLVGYAMIIRGAFAPPMLRFSERAIGAGIYSLICGIATLVCMTMHFGIFHWVQAAFMNDLFPLTASRGADEREAMVEALWRYVAFVPAAALAERHGFALPPPPAEPLASSVRARDIEARKARQSYGNEVLARPYLNVARMHLLIFAFAAVHFVQVESFAAYVTAYALYFFPWRLLLQPTPPQEPRTI